MIHPLWPSRYACDLIVYSLYYVVYCIALHANVIIFCLYCIQEFDAKRVIK